MAAEPRRLSVALSVRALASLEDIWEWNAKTYGTGHADRYVEFLLTQTQNLAGTYAAGRPVPTRPAYRYVLIRRRRRKGHGHIVVYEVVRDSVYVLDYFHTAQDWQNALRER
jgi:plasmid stabilization system protein ParE